jgi:hypothetical protein
MTASDKSSIHRQNAASLHGPLVERMEAEAKRSLQSKSASPHLIAY